MCHVILLHPEEPFYGWWRRRANRNAAKAHLRGLLETATPVQKQPVFSGKHDAVPTLAADRDIFDFRRLDEFVVPAELGTVQMLLQDR